MIAIQTHSIRTVSKAYLTSRTNPRINKFGIYRLEDLCKQQCFVNVHDCVHENAPCPICNLVQLKHNISRFNLRSNSQNPLKVTAPIKSRISSQSFSAKGPAFRNPLSPELKGITRRGSFKNRVKKDMLKGNQTTSESSIPRCRDKKHHHQLD